VTAPDLARLLAAAQAVRHRAYAPYSGFAVGAALLTASGAIFTGCNVENASYGLTLCAERVAVGQAVAAGERAFVALLVLAETADPCWPCGACRQVLYEFAPDLQVLAANPDGVLAAQTLSSLLPAAFTATTLASRRRTEQGR